MENQTDPIRDGVRALCANFSGSYWQDVDKRQAYPEDFVIALTNAGYLAALIPTEYGGSGLGIREATVIMEEIQRSGCNGAACHAQLYTMGTVLRHGSFEQKGSLLPGLASGALRLQAFGVTEHQVAPIQAVSAPRQRATVTATSSTGKRFGRHGWNTQISCCYWPVHRHARRRTRSTAAPNQPMACRFS